jgi:hypothetical protein
MYLFGFVATLYGKETRSAPAGEVMSPPVRETDHRAILQTRRTTTAPPTP